MVEVFWENPDWVNKDRHLLALKRSAFRRPFPKVDFQQGVTLIRGPRQIGKSSLLKTLLKRAIVESKTVYYHSCEDIKDSIDLLEFLKSVKDRSILLLDEISYVREWWRAVKKFTDQFHQVSIVLTGSNSYDLRQGFDQMPGRWARQGEIRYLPMLFDEWLEMRRQASWPVLGRLEALRIFFRVGGFPTALAEAGPANQAPVETMGVLKRWLIGDLAKLKKQELFMREIIGRLALIHGTPTSLQKFAQKTQLMSYHTVQEYLSILEQSFALKTLFAYDPEKDAFRLKKEKKHYFTDPLIYWMALEWSGMKTPENSEEQIAEMVAHEFLSRRYKRLGYFSNPSGEIDFIHEKDFVIEVKWAPSVRNLSKAYKNIRILNKICWSQSDFLASSALS